MFSVFVVVFALNGATLSAGQSVIQFDTLEKCEAFERDGDKELAERLAQMGVPFKEIRSQCLPDIGQSARDVFALPEPETEAPTTVPDPPAQ